MVIPYARMARLSLGYGRRRRQVTVVPDKWLPLTVVSTELGL